MFVRLEKLANLSYYSDLQPYNPMTPAQYNPVPQRIVVTNTDAQQAADDLSTGTKLLLGGAALHDVAAGLGNAGSYILKPLGHAGENIGKVVGKVTTKIPRKLGQGLMWYGGAHLARAAYNYAKDGYKGIKV